MYKEPKHSPYVTNVQKEIIAEKQVEFEKPERTGKPFEKSRRTGKTFAQPPLHQERPQPGQKPLVDLQVYEPSKPQTKKPSAHPSLYLPFQTATPFYPPNFQMPQYGTFGTYGPR